MCHISSQLQLCTCDFKDGRPDNYWRLITPSDSDSILLGQLIAPLNFEIGNAEAQNIKWLGQRLNERNCFDREIGLKENDELELVLNTTKLKQMKIGTCKNAWPISLST